MTEQEARQILMLYRPGSPDAGDADVAEALALARRSPGLQKWFDQHRAAQAAIAASFKKIPVPEGLKEQILSERKSRTAGFFPRTPAAMAFAVAVLAAIIAIAAYVAGPEWDAVNGTGFAAYRSRMVFTALEDYRMDVETNDVAAVRSYLAGRQALADWTVPKGLQQASLTGCGVVRWHGRPVSMVCFHVNNASQPGKTDAWLFVINQDPAHRFPASDQPEFSKVNNLTTASWSADGKTYLLAAQGDEKYLRGLLQGIPPG
jgi:hypothetical protein